MSLKTALCAFGVAAILLVASATKAQSPSYLDVYIAKVKPEKASQAEAIAKRFADINRRNNGDRVITEETMYGEMFTYQFLTQRDSYADVDKGNDAFFAALSKALGKEGAQKIFAEWNSCLVSARTELRMRRPDLSSKMPKDPAEFSKLVGESRVVRTYAIRVRPGHKQEFEGELKNISSHADRMADTQPVLVSEVADGAQGGDTYYITFLRKSLSGFDKEVDLKDIIGEEGLAKFDKVLGEAEQGYSLTIYRFRPDLSYPPDEVANASAEFWNPKPAATASAAAHSKSKAAAGDGAAEKSKDKSN